MRTLSRFLALGAFFVALAAFLSACGSSDSVPGDSVAKVGGDSIKLDEFNHWMKVAAISSAGGAEPDQQQGSGEVPDAPNFTRCIASKKEKAPKPAKGQPKPTDAQFKAQCQQEYNGLRDQVLQFLISSSGSRTRPRTRASRSPTPRSRSSSTRPRSSRSRRRRTSRTSSRSRG